MAGVKGRSGGPRPNSGGPRPNSGGKRPGAGRPRKSAANVPPPVVQDTEQSADPLAFLEGVMRGTIQATPLQVRAAIAAAQYRHMKKGDGGKKDETADKAKKAAEAGRFVPARAPLKVVGR